MRTINRNPLGIRKLDVQEVRREARKGHKIHAERLTNFWFRREQLMGMTPKELTMEEVTRLVEVALSNGWEAGVKDGAKATRDRVAEALDKGTLIKPEA